MDNSGPSFPHGGHAPPQHWFDTWDNRGNQNTSSSALSAKGLRNAPGENNCFLNSAVQVFWHLDVFRRSYRRLTGHLCMGNSCIFCALKVIFTQFQYSDQASLPPDALRKALAESFSNQQRFQLGHMDDAAECFENILRRIHFHIANAYSEDACQAPHCLPHQKFAMTVFDQIVCICGASSEPLTFHELVHYISTSALVSQCRSMHETGDILHPDRFGLLLRNAGAVGDIRDCPNSCGKRVQIRRTLLNCPDVVSIGLVWETDRPNTDMISDVVQSIGTTILLQDVFHSVMVKGMKDVSKLPKLQLSALVCYYGKHYSTFVFHTKLNVWIYFDDATVRQVGPSWDDVVEKCCKGHYQPLLLLYTNPNANPIATETAPKKRVMAPGFSTPVKVPAEKKPECRNDGVRRSITPNPDGPKVSVTNSRRSTTPNPPNASEPISPDTEPGVTKKQVEHHRQHSFLIAVTGKTGRAAEQNKSEYAVPMNNTAVKHRLPGGQGQPSGSENEERNSGRKHRPSDLQLPRPEDSVDGYNYTLSTRDQYRRPSISSPDHAGKPLTPNFSRGEVPPRKDSFKKGKDKVPVDVIRYQVPRTSSTSSDSDSVGHSDQGPAKSGSSQSTAPALPPKHRRTQSICHEDAPQNLSADHIDIRQHVVMKPKPSAGHNYENIENVAHTPVQSGLATLPRNKKGKSAQSMPQGDKASRPSLHNRQGTQAQPGQMDRIYHCRQNSASGQSAHSRESSTHTLTDERHSRQSSMVSQISDPQNSVSQQQGSTHADKPNIPLHSDGNSRKEQTKPGVPSNKPPKPAKPEKKPALSQKKKSSNPPAPPTRKSDLKENSEDKVNYINRNMVETVLQYQSQKLTRQGSNISSVSQSSNTSFDSDNSSVRSHKDSNTEILFDTLSLDSAHRDSGYGSSDRNSSSSTGSTTLDPYAQYFMSKSMIPPKNLNPYGVAENLKKFINHGSEGDRHYGPTTYTVGSVQNGGQGSVQQYPPPDDKYNPDLNYVQSKTETGKSLYPAVDSSHLSVQPADQGVERKQLYDPAIVKSHTQGKGNQVYHMTQKMMPQEVKSAPGNKTSPEGFNRISNQKSEKPSGYHEGADEYLKLCQKAEELMDQCVLVETSENGSMALNYCNAAINCLKQAMRINSLSQQSFVSAQKMHNSCVLKSRSLQKKFLVRQESMSSTTSSDSARSSPCPTSVSSSDHSSPPSSHSYGENCVQQNVLISKLQQNSIHSRSSSRDSVDSVIENKNYRKENRTCVKPPEKSFSETNSNSSLNSNERTSYNQHESDSTADMYATLPRKGTRRSQKGSVSSSSETEVYKDFLNKQRNPNGRTASSGSITPTPNDNCFDTDSSLTDGNDHHYKMQAPSQQQVKANRAEIRQLPHNNGPSSYHPQEYYHTGYTSRHQDSQQSHPYTQSAHPGPHKHEVCKSSAPSQQITTANPALPSKPGKATNLVTQSAKSTSDQGSRESSPRPVEGMMKWVRSTSHSTPRAVKNKSKQNSIARQSSFTGNTQQQSGQGRPHQSTANSQCSLQPPQRLVNNTHCNPTDCSNTEAQRAGFTPEQVPSTISNPPAHQQGCGDQSGEIGISSRQTMQQVCQNNDGGCSEPEEFRPSVRDLASRFEGSNSNATSGSNSRDQQQDNALILPSGNLGRQRSKSESDFRTLDVKPKSVLSRNKQKNKVNRMKKSVTFNDNVALVDLMDIFAPTDGAPDNSSGYVSDQEERYDMATRSYSDNELDDDDSVDSPTEIAPGEVPCSLCGKHGAQYGQYCEKCHHYLGQFQQRR